MDATAKQQIIERIKQANNILVTVSTNPSIDQLASCIGLTLMLNKMGKSATAVYSGKTPSTIEFLQPQKTLTTSTNSLQDFIISLDKSKADKLRYKVEDQVVRIFITPYQTQLSEKDLSFSYGEVNVEVVVALGVKDQTQLDKAITSHGRILHDAAIISMVAGAGSQPSLGQINWQETGASSLSEMLVSLSEAFGSNLIDNQMATAFLTGIVSETERFSNSKTTPKVMTMSAQLMAAGANQQLVVSKLAIKPPLNASPKTAPKPPEPKKIPEEPKQKSSVLSVAHSPTQQDGPEVEIDNTEIHIDAQGNIRTDDDKTSPQKPDNKTSQDQKEPPNVFKEPDLPLPKALSSPPETPQNLTPPPPIEIPNLPDSLKAPQGDQAPMAPPIKSSVSAVPNELPGPHALLDPSGFAPASAASFSASTGSPTNTWQDPYNTVSSDPLNDVNMPNNASQTPTEGPSSNTQAKIVGPPKQTTTPLDELLKKEFPNENIEASGSNLTEDSARSAVENALSAAPSNSSEPLPIQPDDSTPAFKPPGTITPPPPPPPIPPPPFIPGINSDPHL